jgi:hypothetical protein
VDFRFSEKIMLKAKIETLPQFKLIGSGSKCAAVRAGQTDGLGLM